MTIVSKYEAVQKLKSFRIFGLNRLDETGLARTLDLFYPEEKPWAVLINPIY